MQQTDNCQLLLDNQLCFSLYAASRLVNRLYQTILEPLGLTYTQYIVLMILWEDAPCSVSHICSRALLNTNTLTPLLKRLAHDGLINRTRSGNDERIVEISLTAKGAEIKTRCYNVPAQLLQKANIQSDKLISLKRELDEMIATINIV